METFPSAFTIILPSLQQTLMVCMSSILEPWGLWMLFLSCNPPAWGRFVCQLGSGYSSMFTQSHTSVFQHYWMKQWTQKSTTFLLYSHTLWESLTQWFPYSRETIKGPESVFFVISDGVQHEHTIFCQQFWSFQMRDLWIYWIGFSVLNS